MPHWEELVYDERCEDKSVIAVWCYFCYHCGYIWLPRDFDIRDIDTLDREPPKSCARCKSKYWDMIPTNGNDMMSREVIKAIARRERRKKKAIK
jgi:hypothetical protein